MSTEKIAFCLFDFNQQLAIPNVHHEFRSCKLCSAYYRQWEKLVTIYAIGLIQLYSFYYEHGKISLIA